MKRYGLILLLLLAPQLWAAEDQAIVRMEIIPETVSVGEPATMRVTVLGPTWFTRPPVFPSFEIANAVVRLPPDSSMPFSEQVDGETWSGIVRDYEIYPLLAARYSLGGQMLKVSIANPGKDPVLVDVAMPEASLQAIVPAGSEGLDPWLAGRELTLSRNIEGDSDSLEAGDAVVARTVAEIDGLPAIFLPPLYPDLQIEGVSVYADSPLVEDGDTGRRTEQHTLVFAYGGEFTLPAIELDWWNTESESLEKVSVAAMTLTVTGPPAQIAKPVEEAGRDWKALVVKAVAAILLAYLLWRLARVMVVRARQRAKKVKASESYAFKQLVRACAGQDKARVYHSLLAWLERLAPSLDAHRFIRDYGDKSLEEAFAALSEHLYQNPEQQVDLRALASGLEKARQTYQRQQSAGSHTLLPPLNP